MLSLAVARAAASAAAASAAWRAAAFAAAALASAAAKRLAWTTQDSFQQVLLMTGDGLEHATAQLLQTDCSLPVLPVPGAGHEPPRHAAAPGPPGHLSRCPAPCARLPPAAVPESAEPLTFTKLMWRPMRVCLRAPATDTNNPSSAVPSTSQIKIQEPQTSAARRSASSCRICADTSRFSAASASARPASAAALALAPACACCTLLSAVVSWLSCR